MTAEPIRERVVNALVMSPMTDFIGTDLSIVSRTADAVLAVIPDPADVLEQAAEDYGPAQLTGLFLGRDDYTKAWLKARAQTYRQGADHG